MNKYTNKNHHQHTVEGCSQDFRAILMEQQPCHPATVSQDLFYSFQHKSKAPVEVRRDI